MNITDRVLRVYQLDRQLAGLQSRLRAAERFYAEQSRQVKALETKRVAVAHQAKQIAASVTNQENDIKSTEARLKHLREQMANAHTTKEYQGFLTEVKMLDIDKDKVEEEALNQLARADELKAQVAELDTQFAERAKMCKVAEAECATRKTEIASKLSELQAQRQAAASEVPGDLLARYERLFELHEEDAMAPIEITDLKRHEYNCGACMMSLPMEASISLLGGKLTICSNCQCILYITEEATEALTHSSKK